MEIATNIRYTMDSPVQKMNVDGPSTPLSTRYGIRYIKITTMSENNRKAFFSIMDRINRLSF
jgi:hypothetical protein